MKPLPVGSFQGYVNVHELTIISNIFKIIEDIAKENSLVKINKVKLKVGKLRQLYPEMLQNAFEIVAKDTKAENAVLQIESIPVKMKCRSCDEIFYVDEEYSCQRCGNYSLETLEGDEIIIESIEGDQ